MLQLIYPFFNSFYKYISAFIEKSLRYKVISAVKKVKQMDKLGGNMRCLMLHKSDT